MLLFDTVSIHVMRDSIDAKICIFYKTIHLFFFDAELYFHSTVLFGTEVGRKQVDTIGDSVNWPFARINFCNVQKGYDDLSRSLFSASSELTFLAALVMTPLISSWPFVLITSVPNLYWQLTVAQVLQDSNCLSHVLCVLFCSILWSDRKLVSFFLVF